MVTIAGNHNSQLKMHFVKFDTYGSRYHKRSINPN